MSNQSGGLVVSSHVLYYKELSSNPEIEVCVLVCNFMLKKWAIPGLSYIYFVFSENYNSINVQKFADG